MLENPVPSQRKALETCEQGEPVMHPQSEADSMEAPLRVAGVRLH
jgi:hypothetical protein